MTYRYIRKTPLGEVASSDSPIFEEEVEWLSPFLKNRFFTLPVDFPLNSHELFKSGKIVGMDAASVAAVWALQVGPDHSCLDLCCAPGMKLSLIADLCGESRVVGTDINEHRLDVCYNLLTKLGYSELKKNIYQVRGEEVVPFETVRNNRKRRNKQKRQKVAVQNPLETLFDSVLVDTECSHDGSARHVNKHDNGFWAQQGSDKNRQKYSNETELEALIDLQKQLIKKGFLRLKSGGVMVYSTCSLQSKQNEEIVDYLLSEFPDSACGGKLPFACTNDDSPEGLPIVPAKRVNQHSCLFHPESSGTSGQFIAVVSRL